MKDPQIAYWLNSWLKQTPQLEAATVDRIMAWDLNYSEKDGSDWTVGIFAPG